MNLFDDIKLLNKPIFKSEFDYGFAEFSGLTPIWHKTKHKGNSRTKKDKVADDYAVMNEFLFKVEKKHLKDKK